MTDDNTAAIVTLVAALGAAIGTAWEIKRGKIRAGRGLARFIYRDKEPIKFWFGIGLTAFVSIMFFLGFILLIHTHK